MKPAYSSQYRQDEFLNEVVFANKENGFFVDIGAHDGVSISNSLFFEKHKGWKGVCIEPNPNVFNKLIANRQSVNINACIGSENKKVRFTQIEGYSEMLSGITDMYHEKHRDRIDKTISTKGGTKTEIEVDMVTLDSIDAVNGKMIDFISIDTEGNEFEIVKSIDFELLSVQCMVIENNYNDSRVRDYLKTKGFDMIYELDADEVFLQKKQNSSLIQLKILLWKLEKFSDRVLRKFQLKK